MIITNDEEALRIQCVDVLPEEIGPLRDQLERELAHSESRGRPGIGLAAPQIGVAKNMAIVRIDDSRRVELVKCEIVQGYDKAIYKTEGCLSFPGRYEKTLRYQEIVVENNATSPTKFVCTGLMAVVCQHELDHLIGRLLPDIALPKKKMSLKVRPNDLCPCGSGRKYKRCCA